MSTDKMPEHSQGLYQIINSTTEKCELGAKDIADFLSKNQVDDQTKMRLLAWEKELRFWKEYSLIYRNLEKAGPYFRLTKVLEKLIEPNPQDIWLDIGCGPAKMSELIWKKSQGTVQKIVGVDIVLSSARETLARSNNGMPLELVYADIGEELPFPDNHFHGVIANLVLPYVIDFKGKTGIDAFVAVLQEMHRVLKPGGHMVWSMPKENVHFQWVFVASIPSMINPIPYIINRDITRILQGTRILKHALEIQRKGKEGIYSFLSFSEIEKLLKKIGFVHSIWQKSFANQVLINRVCKPNIV